MANRKPAVQSELPEYQLKHRLTGAVVLVTLAVLLIPWLLSLERAPGPWSLRAAFDFVEDFKPKAALSVEEVDVADIKVPPKTASGGTGGAKVTLLDAQAKPLIAAKPTTIVVKTQPPPKLKPIPKLKLKPKPKPASRTAATTGWEVRVGTFAKRANANQVVAALAKIGITSHRTATKTSQGTATRIWIGPYSNRTTAERVAERTRAITGEKGYVKRHRAAN